MSTDQDLCLHGVPKSRKHQSSQYQKITAQITKMHPPCIMLSPSVVVFNCCCHKRSLSDEYTICDAQVIVYINNNHCYITNVSNKVSTNQNINSYCNKISMCNTSRKYSQDSCQVHSTKLSSRPLNKLKMK